MKTIKNDKTVEALSPEKCDPRGDEPQPASPLAAEARRIPFWAWSYPALLPWGMMKD